MSTMSVLPTEILRIIFSMLSNQDLCMVLLVCKRWKELGEDPSLWTWGRARVGVVEVSLSNLKMLGIRRRLEHVQEIAVSGLKGMELEKLFLAVVMRLQHKLSYLNIRNTHLCSVEPGLLATAVTMVKWVDMSHCSLTSQQVNTVFESMCAPHCRLKKLYTEGVNLSTVDQFTLAAAINRLNRVTMHDTQVTVQQVTCLLSQAVRQTKLNTLHLGGMARYVERKIVKQAKQNISNLVIWHCDVVKRHKY